MRPYQATPPTVIRASLRLVQSAVLVMALAGPASAATYTVTNTNNSGSGSLRQAMLSANAAAGTHSIGFAIPGSGRHVIAPTSELPVITRDGATIDGSTQTNASCGTVNQSLPHDLKVELRSAHTTAGLSISADDVTIRGLSITNHQGSAIIVNVGADRAAIDCNNIGIQSDNTVIDANATGSAANVAVFIKGADSTVSNNVISGNAGANTEYGLLFEGPSGGLATGNLVGLKPDGTTAAGNAGIGIFLLSASGVTIGGTTAAERNVVSSNTQFGVGVVSSDGVKVLGNRIGTTADGMILRENGIANMAIQDVTGLEVGQVGAGNVIAGAPFAGVVLQGSGDVEMIANRVGVADDGTTDIGSSGGGVYITQTVTATIGDGTAAGANAIANHGDTGVTVTGSARIALLANVIHSNDGLGIDLGEDGVTANDAGDGDGGPNESLNFPEIVTVAGNGTATFDYAFTLDVPAHAQGYRIDFFENTASETYGEGEVHLGSVDISHAGGDLSFTGTLSGNAAIGEGDRVSATATRKTSGATYDITSEFSLTYTSLAADPAELVVSKAVSVLDDGLLHGDDMVAIPGATLRYVITLRNEGAGATDDGSTVIVDEIPSNGSLKVGDIGLPGAGPVGFTDGSPSSGLTYGYGGLTSAADGLDFSDDDGASWTYAPADGGDGTDPSITHIRVRPDGAFDAKTGTDPSPSLALRYDVVLF